MRKSYVYKITCKINDEFYFGSSFNAKSDKYWGSGRKIKKLISKYGKEHFIKEILGEFDDRTESHRIENQYIEKFRNDEKCLNQQLDHKFDTYSNETRAKHSVAIRGEKNPMYGKTFSEETLAKMSVTKCGEKNPMYGKHHTDNARAKISDALRGEKNPMYGKRFSEETRTKMSAARRGKPHPHGKHWRKNTVTGKREWYD